MSPDDRHEMEQLEGLAAELAEAGHLARTTSARRTTPDPEFAARLRAELLGSLPQALPVPMLVAPVTPADTAQCAPERLADRRALHPAGADGRTTSEPRPDDGKRWRARQIQTISAPRPGVVPAVEAATAPKAEVKPAIVPAAESVLAAGPRAGAKPTIVRYAKPESGSGHVAALRPSVHWRIPTRIPPSRWVALGLVASIVIVSLMVGTTFLFPVGPTASAEVAVATTIVRGGTSTPLIAGAELHEGDVIDVGAGGRATLVMGGSFVRMAPGSELRLDRLDPSHPVVNQLGGRAYHRVSVGPNGNYTVVTGTVTWVATGTAFDLDRHPVGASGEEVTGLALLDGLNLQGPQVKAALNQGQGVVVQLASGGSPVRAPAIDQISAQSLADSWLVQNANLDALAGLDLGELAVDLSPLPQSSLVPGPTVPPTATTADPVRQPTPGPTRKPTPKPTPTGPANLGNLTISDNGDGTYTFSWPKYTGDGFTFYKLVYADWGKTPSYPASPYWACNSGVDENSWTGSISIGDYAVRVQVVDESKSVIRAQTKVVRLNVTGPTPTPAPTPPPTQSLGSLTVQDDGGGYFTFSWAAYTGGWPFDAYKLVYMSWPGSPSYLSRYDGFWAFGTGQTTSGSIHVPSGHWAFRVQAIGTPGGKGYDFARTGVSELTVP
jgi:hypothetical protein